MLFETFLQKLTSELSEKQYKLIYIEKVDGQKEYMALFLKDESPILSFVSVVDFGKNGVIDGYTEKLNGIMEELLNDNKEFFNNAVCEMCIRDRHTTALWRKNSMFRWMKGKT